MLQPCYERETLDGVDGIHRSFVDNFRQEIYSGQHFAMGADFSLSDLLTLQLHKVCKAIAAFILTKHVADVEEIVELATKENKIETQLSKLASTWTK